jgi:glucans biosynthesis protein
MRAISSAQARDDQRDPRPHIRTTAAPVKAVIGVGPEAQLVQQTVVRNAVTGGWRLAFQIKRARGKPLELRAYLQNGKDILTETWCYQLEP